MEVLRTGNVAGRCIHEGGKVRRVKKDQCNLLTTFFGTIRFFGNGIKVAVVISFRYEKNEIHTYEKYTEIKKGGWQSFVRFLNLRIRSMYSEVESAAVNSRSSLGQTGAWASSWIQGPDEMWELSRNGCEKFGC